MTALEETQDPTVALQQTFQFLASAGDHFTGAWKLDDKTEGKRQAWLQYRGTLPRESLSGIRNLIRLTMKSVGWRATGISIAKNHVSFTMAPWPTHEQLEAQTKRESFRQAYRKMLEETQAAKERDQTPEP